MTSVITWEPAGTTSLEPHVLHDVRPTPPPHDCGFFFFFPGDGVPCGKRNAHRFAAINEPPYFTRFLLSSTPSVPRLHYTDVPTFLSPRYGAATLVRASENSPQLAAGFFSAFLLLWKKRVRAGFPLSPGASPQTISRAPFSDSPPRRTGTPRRPPPECGAGPGRTFTCHLAMRSLTSEHSRTPNTDNGPCAQPCALSRPHGICSPSPTAGTMPSC
jgi:hypothetical protein